ncbi:semaphorin-7A [Symphorus nematophorus]
MFFLTVFLLFSCLSGLTGANSKHLPRMLFTDKETAMKKLPLPENHVPVQIVLERTPDNVTVVGREHLISFDFQNPQKTPVERKVPWTECSSHSKQDCNYKITVVHKREDANKVFVCGTNVKETICCDMNLSEQSHTTVIICSVFAESANNADLYIAYSGSQQYVGIHRFGSHRVTPANQDKEHHYVGLMLSRQRDNPTQDKVYAFYREKNRDSSLDSEMWIPFVTQVCMADIGGPKNSLQFTWTSQLSARLFCGDPDSRQHFPELVDVATVHADRWQDTRVYALFRNEWGMSAVCVYTIEDIDHIFKTSPFKGNQENRSRMCVRDSRKIPSDTLKMIEKTSEMEHWVRPVRNSGPILFNHHNYTHIYIDSSQHKRNNDQPVLFLSLNHGGIHKVVMNKSHTFIIAEYQPFNHSGHIFNIILQPSSKKLYVNSRSELVQLNVANCAQYGDSCEDCVLARDPYCGWNGTHCSPDTTGTVQDVAQGNHTICTSMPKSQPYGKVSRYSTSARADEDADHISLPPQSKYFLQCPVTSRHAQYTWRHPGGSTTCSSREQQCLLLIDSMGHGQEGSYSCVSEEKGYSRVLAHHQLGLRGGAAGHSSSPLVWVCLMAVLIKSLI